MVQNDLNFLIKNDKKSDKIFVAGHNGLAGSSVLRLLKKI